MLKFFVYSKIEEDVQYDVEAERFVIDVDRDSLKFFKLGDELIAWFRLSDIVGVQADE